MARRSKPYITQFFNHDRLAFTALSRVGHVNREQMSNIGIADSRMKNYIRDGLVEKVTYKQGNRTEECYKLTKSGRELAKQQWALIGHYHAQSPRHDLALARKYFSLSEELQRSWRTETELREQFVNMIEKFKVKGAIEADRYEQLLERGILSFPDALYVNEQGVEIVYESITNNYGVAELMSKETYVEIMKCEYETIRV
ncbi:hypothetical protein BSK62_22030 [Paenibacillus odorifer]|uniref:hypothetical protein n=1 Tax=Paenibacillus odorifer TaxID=189426 RepID=UPI00096DCB6C|nr:hypothetical protein [Paenibacillus odorifer]OMD62989.1 hypothetical protein BSK62_22030 [Paenibacillus odorifer]